jgi:hypothetical protein
MALIRLKTGSSGVISAALIGRPSGRRKRRHEGRLAPA